MRFKYMILIILALFVNSCKPQPVPDQKATTTSDSAATSDTIVAVNQELAKGAILAAKKYLDCFAAEDTACLRTVSIPESSAGQIELISPLFKAYNNIQILIGRLSAPQVDEKSAIVTAYFIMKGEPVDKNMVSLGSQQQVNMEIINQNGEWKVVSNGM